jgi:hypothetical protein
MKLKNKVASDCSSIAASPSLISNHYVRRTSVPNYWSDFIGMLKNL